MTKSSIFLRILVFIFLCLAFWVGAQKTISSEILVKYILESKQSLKENAINDRQEFYLVANGKQALFKPVNAFIYDSLSQQGYSMKEAMKYYDLRDQANLHITANEFYFSDLVMNSEIGYKEKNTVTWKITDEFDKVAGVECQKATTSLYGRDWTACFSPDIPIPFGPYKFNNLPGLILQVYDSENHYNFKVVEIKKYRFNYKVDRFSNAKLFSKPDFMKVKENLESDYTLGGKFKFKPEDIRKFTENRNNRLKFENPLERIP